ncbi:secreted protein [Nemania diffusa]|nr:secreted protein [Nemania diffusa]
MSYYSFTRKLNWGLIAPATLPGCATDTDKKWQPAMDFNTDGGYNNPTISIDGAFATELSYGGAKDNISVYSRAWFNGGWCGFPYGYYFEKDQTVDGSCGVSHKNDWEHHGNYEVKPATDVSFQDTDAKFGDLVGFLGFPYTETRGTMLGVGTRRCQGRRLLRLASSKGGNDVLIDMSVDSENSSGSPSC